MTWKAPDMTANLRNFRMATACLFAAAPLTLSAQDAGIVRISDGKPKVQTAGHSDDMVMSGDMSGYGYDGSCPHCQGGNGKHSLFGEKYCSHSADFGYSIPGKWPIQRRGVQYQQLFPYAWYGSPQWQGGMAAPQVYQPTDTTQLGYYYQHVPFWQPQPNPLPARPVPAQWHRYAPAVYASQYGAVYSKGMMGGNCPVEYGMPVYNSTTPSTTSPTELQPVPEPAQPQALPPEPVKESAVPLPLQRASY